MRRCRLIPRLTVLLITGVITSFAIAVVGTSLFPPDHGQSYIAQGSWAEFRSLSPFARHSTLERPVMIDGKLTLKHPKRMLDASRTTTWLPDAFTRILSANPIIRVPEEPHDRWHIYESGWPARSFWGWRVASRSFFAPSPGAQGGVIVIERPSADPWFSVTQLALPFLPLWSGLILNTLFYAAIWWAILAIPRTIRRALRIRRGLCRFCGYDMRGLTNTPCPECGPQ